MVRKDNLYLFLGQDIIGQDGSSRKDTLLKKIKEKFIPPHLEDFNLDILYARDLKRIELQKKFLSLPFKSEKRMIIIRDTQDLKQDARSFLLSYLKHPKPSLLLVLDVNHLDPKDEFIRNLRSFAQVYHFRQTVRLDAFSLSRQIDLKRPDYALRVLSRLLKAGERPERILGGLRYSWDRNIAQPLLIRKKVKLLLNCDLEIKTGRLKAHLALEKLVVRLCSL